MEKKKRGGSLATSEQRREGRMKKEHVQSSGSWRKVAERHSSRDANPVRKAFVPKSHSERETASVTENHEIPEDVLIGRNAVMEALKSGRGINKLLVARGDKEGSIQEILFLAKERGLLVELTERAKIDAIAAGMRHQGVLAYVAPVAYVGLEEILAAAEAKQQPPFLLLLDELEDPHNLGALLRTADAAGVHGVLIPKRRSCPLSATVAKTSAGAVEYVPVARIGNIVQTLRELKEKGLWVIGADMEGENAYYDANLTGPVVLVVGSEGRGISRLVKENCDILVRLPMAGRINSLNASVAGSILLYEIMRQRAKQK